MADLLLERAEELAAIEKAIRMARAGCSRRVLITGPPGSGRTTLLERARASARDQGLSVLAARGEAREHSYPFALARRLLEPPSALPDGYEALESLNRALVAHAPVLVCIDDVEDADTASLDWLAFAARRLPRVGVAFVLAGETTRFEAAVALSLRPFSEQAVAALLHVELGHAVDAAHARACHVATGGHALLVCELAAAAARGRRPELVPPGVTRFLERRLARLPDDARCLAEAIALLDGAATLHDAARLAGLSLEHAAAAADRLRSAGLLNGGEALTIAPPLLARALYESIPPARRALWHARAARAAGHPAGAIRHLLRSEPSADGWVVDTLATAGRGRSPAVSRERRPRSCAAPFARARAIAASC